MRLLTKLLHVASVASEEGARGVLSSKEDLAGNGAHRFPPSQDICWRTGKLVSGANSRAHLRFSCSDDFCVRGARWIKTRQQRWHLRSKWGMRGFSPSKVVFEDPDGPICTTQHQQSQGGFAAAPRTPGYRHHFCYVSVHHNLEKQATK